MVIEGIKLCSESLIVYSYDVTDRFFAIERASGRWRILHQYANGMPTAGFASLYSEPLGGRRNFVAIYALDESLILQVNEWRTDLLTARIVVRYSKWPFVRRLRVLEGGNLVADVKAWANLFADEVTGDSGRILSYVAEHANDRKRMIRAHVCWSISAKGESIEGEEAHAQFECTVRERINRDAALFQG